MSNQPRLERYVDTRGEHRWRVIAPNGRIISESSEGYHDPADRDRGITITAQALSRPRRRWRRNAA